MFKGTPSSLLCCLRQSTPLAGLPSGHGVARAGQILIYFIVWQTGGLEAAADTSLQTPALVALACSCRGLPGPCPVREPVSSSRGTWLPGWLCSPWEGNETGLRGCAAPRAPRQSRARASVCPAGLSTGSGGDEPRAGAGWQAC